KHLAKLNGDVASAYDQEMFRHRLQLHDRSRIQRRHSIESGDRRDDRLGPRVDEDLFSAKAQGLTTGAFNFHSPRIDETRPSMDDIQILGSFYPLLRAISKALDDLLLALPHLSQIHFHWTSLHAIITRPPGKIGDTRACRHGFSRRSTVIDAASSHISLFDDSGLEPRPSQHHRKGEPSLAGAGGALPGRRR